MFAFCAVLLAPWAWGQWGLGLAFTRRRTEDLSTTKMVECKCAAVRSPNPLDLGLCGTLVECFIFGNFLLRRLFVYYRVFCWEKPNHKQNIFKW